MSASIDTMLYVGETPWHGLGTHYEVAPTSAEEVIKGAKLGWEVAATPMKTDFHDRVMGYHAIYREDNAEVLGVVNKTHPKLVQNSESFNAFDKMIGESIDVDTAASLGRGETVFGCFKIRDQYKVLDDEVDHYFVVMNDHLKADGKVTVLNTPVRVVCQNTLSAALSNNFYKLRIPISTDSGVNTMLASNLLTSVTDSMKNLQKRAEDMVSKKINKEYVERLLDELFPYISVEDPILHSRANERTTLLRETFIQNCMGADNLQNYRGTQYQVYNALTDFTQHYFRDVDKGYDLNHRMKLLHGVGTDSESNKVTKFLKIADKLIA